MKPRTLRRQPPNPIARKALHRVIGGQLVALSLTSAAFAGGPGPDLSGPRTIIVSLNGDVAYNSTCYFTQSGGRFSGPCTDSYGGTFRAAGSVNGVKVELTYDGNDQDGTPQHKHYAGVMEGDGSVHGLVGEPGQVQADFMIVRGYSSPK